ncbi:hypothetical protein NA57DRAFT_36319 [Rhizodiscina lignyota]|uniref:Tcp11-domain-containing protein n=1 Tax=Rhizodiscina lignyota TaxID=1504668 RepID=A0A9P4IKD3_9PEZI|nr:hypothetical protein NA57DRAFT_36319 [Rhizodiscina lignyota]
MPDKIDIPDPPANDDIPEEIEEDGMILNGTDTANHVYAAPPPRIAARFWRPSTNRRRSSATSSRRNSMSSTHSHTSARSLHGGCQSNHVAQHLRRASIIESRKARLADRAAHAEQVRLRAALAKAAPRASNSEERALAAQKARERHLAQVAAACAEEVKRAKKVAEDMKERKAAEEKRYRLEMEEKLAEAEKRRLLYNRTWRRPRTSSSPSKKPTEVTRVLTSDAAAKRIQAAWRTKRRRNILDEFSALNLSIDPVAETSFEAMGQFIAEDRVLSATGRVLRLLNLLDDVDATSSQTSIRTFLSAYLVLGHPAEVLSSKDGDQEKDLITKAKELVISFEALLTKAMASQRYSLDLTQLETLSFANTAYNTAFNDWKARDASILIETMVASFVNLDAIWQSVKDYTDGEVANDYREGIRDNQVLLLSRIKKLAGPDRATMLIKKAIRESRRSRPRRRPVGDVRPRPALEGSPASSEETAVESSTSVTPVQDSEATPEGQEAAALAKIFSILPDNRILVHELAIDKEFRIDNSPHSNLRNAVNREICESMRRGFENGEGDAWTVAMADNIRAKLLKLLKPGNSLHTLISETLDTDFVSRQCAQGVFSYEKFFTFMANILPKLCAPVRDEQVKTLAEDMETPGSVSEMIDKLFRLLHVIDLLSLDYSNFLLMNAAPTLIKQSAGYEQRMFAQDLDAGRITLARTKRWWNDAAVNVITESDRRDPLHRPTTQKIYARGLVDLAIATATLQENDLPETLNLDRARIIRIRAESARIATIAAIFLNAKNLLKRDVRSQWKPEASRMWDALKTGFLDPDESLSARLLSIIESGHPMPASTRSQLANTITRLLQQAERGRLTDPLIKVLFQRLKTHAFNRLSASSSGERVRFASTASEGLASSGMAEFVPQVSEIVDTLGKMGEVDQKAHGIWYEQIAKEFEDMGQDVDE